MLVADKRGRSSPSSGPYARPVRLHRALTPILATALAFGAPLVAQPEVGAAGAQPSGTCRADGPVAEAMLPTVEPIVARWLGEHPKSTTPGFAVAVVGPAPDDPAQSQTALITCGVLAEGDDQPVVPATPFELGSETKLFTSTALAAEVLAGRIDLDAPVQDFAPPGVTVPDRTCTSTTGSTMTLRDLATHDSGLRDDPGNITWDAAHPEGHSAYTRDDLWGAFTANGAQPCEALLTDPGTAYSYSNWGFALLGAILADHAQPGQPVPPYADLVGRLVTGPLGMTDTMLQPIPPPAAQAVPTCTAPVVSPCYWNNVNAFAGAGGAISTITDMATFIRANLGFDTANPAWPAIRLTHQPAGIGQDCGECMGLGWEITPAGRASFSPLQVLAKDGGTWGSHSQTYLLPDACWGLTILSTSDSASAVGASGTGGDLVRALAPTTASACGADAPPAPAEPLPSTSVAPTAVAATPRFTG